MLKFLCFLALQCYNTIAIAQVCFRNVLMLARSLLSVPALRPKRRRENAEIFAFLRVAML